MSKSYRTNPIHGITKCCSEKADKRHANRAWRRIVKVRIANGDYDVLPLQKEVAKAWDFGKDGKRWWDVGTAVAKGIPLHRIWGK